MMVVLEESVILGDDNRLFGIGFPSWMTAQTTCVCLRAGDAFVFESTTNKPQAQ